MAAPQTDQHEADTVLGNIDSNEEKRSITQKHTEDIEDGEQESAIISGSSTNENKREESGDVPHEDHSEENPIPPPETSCPDVSRCQEDSSSSPQSVDRGGGTLGSEPQTVEEDDQVGGPHEDAPDGIRSEQTDDEVSLDNEQRPVSDQAVPFEHILRDVEDVGPSTQETPEPSVPAGHPGGTGRYLRCMGVVVAVVAAVLVNRLLQAETLPQKENVRQIDIFLQRMEKLKTEFPNQRPELWKRSKIHLLKHLQAAQPTEPVSLILAAGVTAERTLSCLAHGLASSYSSALNASVLHIDGASKAQHDSDQVKLDIDSNLQVAFEGDKPVAVIHRFEELPPGSTLIFYRYCDHENAAYKRTFLIFTVLLSEEEEIPAESRLNTVEEMVDDHLQRKFLTGSHPISFDRMDRDKYGGLWSRISHLILPVTAEKRAELKGC
ncbi:unnamed protein product, partial [Tetraodon nigroviridis]